MVGQRNGKFQGSKNSPGPNKLMAKVRQVPSQKKTLQERGTLSKNSLYIRRSANREARKRVACEREEKRNISEQGGGEGEKGGRGYQHQGGGGTRLILCVSIR